MKTTILLVVVLLFTGCSTKDQTPVGYKNSQNYNHKPYIKLKKRRELKRLRNE